MHRTPGPVGMLRCCCCSRPAPKCGTAPEGRPSSRAGVETFPSLPGRRRDSDGHPDTTADRPSARRLPERRRRRQAQRSLRASGMRPESSISVAPKRVHPSHTPGGACDAPNAFDDPETAAPISHSSHNPSNVNTESAPLDAVLSEPIDPPSPGRSRSPRRSGRTLVHSQARADPFRAHVAIPRATP